MAGTNQFLTNYTEKTFLEKIRDNLRQCKSFYFSVSFIKKAGLVLLINDIKAAVERGAKGRIITSTYQNFTDVESLKSLKDVEKKGDFQCHLDFESFHDNQYTVIGYHSKGYLFEFEDNCEIIVGSSNITRYALLKNIEWDLSIADSLDCDVYMQGMAEFTDKWEHTQPLSSELINEYSNRLNFAIERWDMDYELDVSPIKPNYMQRKALKELNRYRAMGTQKALVVASAGSGKTYLAAFDALNFNPKRLLYIVHEGSILKKSLETFQSIFGNDVSYGIYNGESKELDADFVFATNVTMSNNLELFDRNTFDYIIIDECHHAAAQTYRNIMEYFQPEFLVGLTATPERMDNQDVFEMFDKNVPYELRLRDAIINDLVVPFKYYGIRDTLVDYGLKSNEERKLVAQLADEEHCSFVIDQIEKHRPAGKLKALMFCRNITHARMMCEALSESYHTAYLTGKNNIGERVRAYNDLQNDSSDLEILCTVDILNEGVDIPGVNMVLFLRPTDSSTVFIQQLGRGLRKYENKDYVTVLDFIGNSYKRSVQIAFALGSLATNLVLEKRLMMEMVKDDFKLLGLSDYGVEINIDDLSKEEIVEWLDNENFNSLKYMEQDYFNFKKYMNCEGAPKHVDYLNNDCAPDLKRFMSIKVEGKKTDCYYNFLKRVEKEGLPLFSDEQVECLKYLSTLLPLVRSEEYKIVQVLLDGYADYDKLIASTGSAEEVMNHALRFMIENGIVQIVGKEAAAKIEVEGLVDTFTNSEFKLSIPVDADFRAHVEDLIAYGLIQYSVEYANEDEFLLWHSYGISQVQMKLLKNPGAIFKGTFIYGKKVLIFASLKKDASTGELLNYKDKFLTPDVFQWESENDVSADALNGLINSDFAYVFVRKMSIEHGIVMPFTYVGKGTMTNARRQEKTDSKTGKVGVTYLFDIMMENELPDYLQYDFGVSK